MLKKKKKIETQRKSKMPSEQEIKRIKRTSLSFLFSLWDILNIQQQTI
jgi:hypothetical protein